MTWTDYLARLSLLLVARSGETHPLDILQELDGFHREALARGEEEGAFIAALGTPEEAARNLREETPDKRVAPILFALGVGLLLALVAVAQLRGVFWRLHSWPLVAATALFPAALWLLFRIPRRTVASLFQPRGGGLWARGYWLGCLILTLFFIFLFCAPLWQDVRPALAGTVRILFEWALLLLGAAGLALSLRDVYRCRLEGFPACCGWLGLLCTKTLAIAPLVSTDDILPPNVYNCVPLSDRLIMDERPALVCFALTLLLVLLLSALLKKKRKEVAAQWTHS